MGLDSIYDYRINSPLDYSSEEDGDNTEIGFTSLWGCEAEPIPDYETQLIQLKDEQTDLDQRLLNLERVVAELGEKKPLFQMTPGLVVVWLSMTVIVVALIMYNQ